MSQRSGALGKRRRSLVIKPAREAANYGNLVDAIDRAKLAGATTVGLATDAPR